MHRFYLPPDECRETSLLLTGREGHHALHVLRVREGEKLIVLDGAGQEILCDVGTVNRNEVRLKVVQRIAHPPSSSRITLLQAVPKGKLFESIVQKATELSAHRIVPLLSGRVVVKFDDVEVQSKIEKWRHVAIEAIKQCGSSWLPQIEPPMTPSQFLTREERFDLSLVAALEGDRRHLREWFANFQAHHNLQPATVCIWIGPEGDFTPEELHDIKKAGACPITLGSLVLRAETAAIYCLSVLNYELHAPATVSIPTPRA